MYDFERAECAQDKNHGLLLLQPTGTTPVFCCNGTLLENVQEFEYLGATLSQYRKISNASCGEFAQSWVTRTGSMPCPGFFKSLHSLQAFMDVKSGLQIL